MLKQGARGLYALLDVDTVGADRLFVWAEAALAAGVGLLQYRDKHASPGIRRQRAETLAALAQRWHTPLIINDDVALALHVSAAGVHVGQQDVPVALARSRLGARAIIGATCHDQLALARQAVRDGASYVAFGRFFPSATKPEATPARLGVLEQARRLNVPVVAIGGIGLQHAERLLRAGADWLAVSGGLFRTDSADEVHRRTEAFNRLIQAFDQEDCR